MDLKLAGRLLKYNPADVTRATYVVEYAERNYSTAEAQQMYIDASLKETIAAKEIAGILREKTALAATIDTKPSAASGKIDTIKEPKTTEGPVNANQNSIKAKGDAKKAAGFSGGVKNTGLVDTKEQVEDLGEEEYDRIKDRKRELGLPGPGDGDEPSNRKPTGGTKGLTPEEQRKAQANSKRAFDTVVKNLRAKHGNNAVLTRKEEVELTSEGIRRAIKKGVKIAKRVAKDMGPYDPGGSHTIGTLGQPHLGNEDKRAKERAAKKAKKEDVTIEGEQLTEAPNKHSARPHVAVQAPQKEKPGRDAGAIAKKRLASKPKPSVKAQAKDVAKSAGSAVKKTVKAVGKKAAQTAGKVAGEYSAAKEKSKKAAQERSSTKSSSSSDSDKKSETHRKGEELLNRIRSSGGQKKDSSSSTSSSKSSDSNPSKGPKAPTIVTGGDKKKESSSSSSSSSGSTSSGTSSSKGGGVKRAVKKTVGITARAVSKASGYVASRMGEETTLETTMDLSRTERIRRILGEQETKRHDQNNLRDPEAQSWRDRLGFDLQEDNPTPEQQKKRDVLKQTKSLTNKGKHKEASALFKKHFPNFGK